MDVHRNVHCSPSALFRFYLLFCFIFIGCGVGPCVCVPHAYLVLMKVRKKASGLLELES